MLHKNFLIGFNDKIRYLMRKGQLNQELLQAELKKKNITFYARTKKDIIKSLSEIESLLDKVLSIAYKPKIITNSTETMLRSEMSPAISNESFQKTLRDSSLWKQKSNEMSPEYLYSTENNDTINTYENRFIVLLTKYLDSYVRGLQKLYYESNSSIYYYYRINDLSYGYSSTIRDLENNLDNLSEFLFKNKNNAKQDINTHLNNTLNKLKRIKATNFYQTLVNEKVSLPVMQTNVLIHDPLYSYCYQYYKRNLEQVSSTTDLNDAYYNYVCYRIIRYFLDNKYTINKSFNLDFIEGKLTINNLKVKQDGFDILINSEENKIKVSVSKNNIESNYNLIPTIDVIDKVKSENEVTNIYLALTNQSNNFDNVCLISYYRDIDNMTELKTLFKSFTISFKNPRKTLKHCLICGHEHLKEENGIYICEHCHSEFYSYKRYRANHTWVKKIS